MRIRGTKPEFWRSERIGSVSWDARLVLKGLESYVDDNGVGKDDIALIIGDLFQRDLVREPSRTLARVSEAISELNTAGLVWRYDDNGTHLLYVSFWETIQRVDKPQSGRFPRPDGTMDYKSSLIRESVVNPRECSRALAPGTGEQGNRGTDKKEGGYVSREPHQGTPTDESPPPPHCSRHMPAGTTAPCRGCADARRALEDWDASARAAAVAEIQRRRQDAHEAQAAAIHECLLCGEDGYRNGIVCDHIDRTETSRAGREAVDAALKGNR